MAKNNYIYIFLHIPKTAGSTFVYHLKKNFKEEELLHLSFEAIKLDCNNPAGSLKRFKKKTKKFVGNLSDSQREKIKVVYGHAAFWGVHKYFKREARYVAFFRDPATRAVSFYNHRRRLFEEYSKLSNKKKQNLQDTLLINNKAPSFEKWLDKKFDTNKKTNHLSVYGFLEILGYLDNPVNKKSINNLLNKFYFVGTTSNYEEGSLFLYRKLNIEKFFLNQNVAKINYAPVLSEKLVKKINSKSKFDKQIYISVEVKRNKFIANSSNYKQIVRFGKIKKSFLLPFTQIVLAPIITLRYIARKLISTLKYN